VDQAAAAHKRLLAAQERLAKVLLVAPNLFGQVIMGLVGAVELPLLVLMAAMLWLVMAATAFSPTSLVLFYIALAVAAAALGPARLGEALEAWVAAVQAAMVGLVLTGFQIQEVAAEALAA